jgi:tyrosyl-tRNA synthetase
MDVYDTLQRRGFIEACTNETGLRALLGEGPVTCYIGFDPTARSLHAGNLLQILLLAHMQRAGHRVIALVGGGTAMVGDPSGKTETRRMLDPAELEANKEGIRRQLRHFIDLGESGAPSSGSAGRLLDNAEWLLPLNYVSFLREIGRHFSVNRMLTAESTRLRLEKGLSFLEFNYQILQAYDFLELWRRHGCRLQLGGSDQWGNIVAGVDLARRIEQVELYGLTSPLVTTSTGEKMGKTAAGAVWLDPELLPPYDYYQFWRNTADSDVERFLKLFTFVPLPEIDQMCAEGGAALNRAKERLALEATSLLHGEVEARKAQRGAQAAFGLGGSADEVPTLATALPRPIVDLLVESGLCSSRSDARRQIQGGGIRLGEQHVADQNLVVEARHLDVTGAVLLWKGKKQVCRITVPTSDGNRA